MFSRSLPKSFNSDDEKSPPQSPTATAKPGFSIITQTIGRQLHNVASFLAPPPQQPSSSSPPLQSDDLGEVSPPSTSSYIGIKNDLAEIGGSFKTGLSLLSSNKAVSEISKFASHLLQFDHGVDLDHEDSQPVGITDDVINFVREISLRPECWIDIPLSLQNQDFSLSDIQKDHTSAIQQLVPNLNILRLQIQNHMSEQHFWMIYFILLLPRLNEDDYTLLSTPEIVQIREVLLQKLRDKNKMEVSENINQRVSGNTSVTEKGSVVDTSEQDKIAKTERHEDDVSLSDIEDEDNEFFRSRKSIQRENSRLSSASEISDWVRLNEPKASRLSGSEESSDWHAIEDVDF